MDNIEIKRKELETIIMNCPEICDALLCCLQEAKDRQDRPRSDREEV